MINVLEYKDEIIHYKVNIKDIKHIYFYIDKDGLTVNSNRYKSQKNIEDAIISKIRWIKSHLKKIKSNIDINSSEKIPLLGSEIDRVLNIDKFYYNMIKKYIPPIAEKYSSITKLRYSKITYKKYKRRWGSCTKDELSFNSYLVILPIECIEYVVLHEIAHIKHKNHSKLFYNFIYQYMPNYKEMEKKIKNFKYKLI